MQTVDEKGVALSHGNNRRVWTGVAMAILGLLLILGDQAVVFLSRGKFAEIGPHAFTALWCGAGGLLLLYFTAGLPLGAVLLAAGAARMFHAPGRVGRVLWPLFFIQAIYFIYHGVAAFRYTQVPTATFTILGWIFVLVFLALVSVWARKRSKANPESQRALDLQMAGGICVFAGSWQACGLAGVPGFAVYPELAQKLANQSFLVGQAMAIQFFTILGLMCFLLSVRLEPSKDDDRG